MRLTTRIATVGTAILLLTPNLSRATDILFLTGSPTPTAADQAILNQLTSLGYTVTQKDGHASSPLDMIGEHLLVTSATLGSSVIKNQWNSTGPVVTAGDGAQYRNLPYPILNFQNGISDEMGMTNSTNGGQGAGTNSGSAYPGQGTDIKIVDAASPLAAGLPAGFQSIFSANPAGVEVFGNTNFGPFGNQVAPGVDIVASITSLQTGSAAIDSAFAGIESIELGGTLGNLTPAGVAPGVYDALAPARRVQFPIDPTSFTNLNANGIALFDAAVNYAFAGVVVPEPSTFALAGMGLAGLLAYRLRRGRQS